VEGVEDVEDGEREQEQEDEAEEGGRRALLAASSGGGLHCPRRLRPSLRPHGFLLLLAVGFFVDRRRQKFPVGATSQIRAGGERGRVRFLRRARRGRSAGCPFSSRLDGSGSGSPHRLRSFLALSVSVLRLVESIILVLC